MSPGITFSLHTWRGIGGDVEPSLFWWRFRFGFATVSVDKISLYAAYLKLRAAIVERVRKDEEGR